MEIELIFFVLKRSRKMQFPTSSSIQRISSALISYSIPTHLHPSRRKMSNLLDSYNLTTKHRRLLKSYKYRLADFTVNEHKLERIMTMGPDFACMEWLMNAGATSVKLSDGTTIGSQKEMRKFLAAQGFNVKKLITKPPHVQILKHFEGQNNLRSLIIDENEYNKRWPHISPIHLKEVDASDAAITGNGCKYFLECRNIEKIKFNHNTYLMDSGLDELSKGRAARTLKELEICYNPYLTDSCATFLCRLTGLQRLHMYVLPGIGKRDAVRRKVNRALLKCKITFPKAYLIGYGYETEEQIEAYRRYYREEASFFVRWLNDESEKFLGFLGKRWENKDK